MTQQSIDNSKPRTFIFRSVVFSLLMSLVNAKQALAHEVKCVQTLSKETDFFTHREFRQIKQYSQFIREAQSKGQLNPDIQDLPLVKWTIAEWLKAFEIRLSRVTALKADLGPHFKSPANLARLDQFLQSLKSELLRLIAGGRLTYFQFLSLGESLTNYGELYDNDFGSAESTTIKLQNIQGDSRDQIIQETMATQTPQTRAAYFESTLESLDLDVTQNKGTQYLDQGIVALPYSQYLNIRMMNGALSEVQFIGVTFFTLLVDATYKGPRKMSAHDRAHAYAIGEVDSGYVRFGNELRRISRSLRLSPTESDMIVFWFFNQWHEHYTATGTGELMDHSAQTPRDHRILFIRWLKGEKTSKGSYFFGDIRNAEEKLKVKSYFNFPHLLELYLNTQAYQNLKARVIERLESLN